MNAPLLSARALLGSAPTRPLSPELANLSTLSLARSVHGDRCQVRGLERIIAEKRWSFYTTAVTAPRDLLKLRNRIAREQSQLADLLTPMLGTACPSCRCSAQPGELESFKDGALECSCDGERWAVECGELVAVVSCDECSNLAVKADCLTDGDDYFCSECCEASAERHYQRTGRLV